MSREDVKRYIEMEVPDIGMVQNDPASVVCLNPDCEEAVGVDPATLVLEDEDATEPLAEEYDHEAGEKTGRVLVELYCSYECRNARYNTDSDRSGGGDCV